ncbi:MAG: 5'/3'-nucleotidase SurE [Bacteroidales bacterium]|jgi:5'-nucleotidase|nr:5'/3'-nucleotidase SurE [Bacteroidales bacterium]
MNRPLILVTNDDGYESRGLKHLVKLMLLLGDVVSISPDKPMSAKGHSITTTPTLEAKLLNARPGFREFVCNGTPVDCVKMGYQVLLDATPDLVVSGINHGSNASSNVIYSGTMGAAIEACMDGLNAIGFSLDSYDPEAYLDHLDDYIVSISKKVLAEGLPKNVCLNVNFPAWNGQPFKGLKVCRQAMGRWVEAYTPSVDENGRPCLKMGGRFVFEDGGGDTDFEALNDNYVSLVPTHFDMTARHCIEQMRHFEHLFN